MLLAKYIISVKKEDGSEYEPSTLRGLISSVDRYLKDRDYGTTVINGQEFHKTREALQAKQKELKSQGKGCKAGAAAPISPEEIKHLWDNGQFGAESPQSMINTLWFFFTVGFGLRGAHEHRSMCWGDIQLHTDESGQEYLSFLERQTKTRQGENINDVRKVKPKLWANFSNQERCPIFVYKKYSEKRPEGFSTPSDPFYIATSTRFRGREDETWFMRQPIGKNKLGNLMKTMAKTLPNNSKNLTNHSARKYLVQTLIDHDIPATDIVQISGHKNVQSVLNYSHMSEKSHKRLSSLIHTEDTTPVKRQKTHTKSTSSTNDEVPSRPRSNVIETNVSVDPEVDLDLELNINNNEQTEPIMSQDNTLTPPCGDSNSSSDERPNFDLGFDFNSPVLSSLFSGNTNVNINNLIVNVHHHYPEKLSSKALKKS